jgi:transcriptional regulator with XRE-family HTH domain
MTTERPVDAKEAWKRWEAGQADLVVAAINELREDQNLTIKDIAQRLGEFGWPVSTSTLLGILSGKKRTSFSTGEIFAFAAAVNVPPLSLLLGLPAADGYPMTPVSALPSANLDRYEWVTGIRHYAPDLIDTEVAEGAWGLASTELAEMRQYAHALRTARWQNSILSVANEFDARGLEKVFPDWMLSGSALRQALDDMWDIYGRWPGLPVPQDLAVIMSEPEFDPTVVPVPIADLNSLAELQRARDFVKENLAGQPQPRAKEMPNLSGQGR